MKKEYLGSIESELFIYQRMDITDILNITNINLLFKICEIL